MPRQTRSSPDKVDHKNIRVFKQHGFVPEAWAGSEQIRGNCIFCSREDHFYINTETKMWDCKSCGKNGGFKTFLSELVAFCQSEFSGSIVIKLSKDRGLLKETLIDAELGYNPYTSSYIIPVYDSNHKDLWDVRIYKKGNTIKSSTGCQVGLYGWDKYKTNHDTIWLCEGEWDTLALKEALNLSVDVHQSVVYGVPGANTFKDNWITFFKDKRVHVLYDKDKAGSDGSIKIYKLLMHVVKHIDFIVWPERYDEGFDLRDYYIKKMSFTKRTQRQKLSSFFRGLQKSLEPLPYGYNIEEDTQVQKKVEYSGDGIPFNEVYTSYKKWLHMPDVDILDVMFGTVIANRLDGDPLWMFIVAPSGGAKTELLMSLDGAINITTTTSMTPHALVSGSIHSGGSDPSMVPKLDGRVLVVKDFTTILSLPQAIRDEIFAILRDAYDGKTEKHFGTGVIRSYVSKFGVLAGVTPEIDRFTEGHTALGERFLRYKMSVSNDIEGRREFLRRAMGNINKETKMKEELSNTAKMVLDHDYTKIPEIPNDLQEKVMDIAQFTSILRATVTRDKYTKEVTHIPTVELGTRLAKQFTKLMLGIGMFKSKTLVGDSEFKIVKDISLSTIPANLYAIIRFMYSTGNYSAFTIQEIGDAIRLPKTTCTRLIENLHLLHALTKKRINTVKTEWSLSPDILELIESTGVFTKTTVRRRK